MTRSVWKVPFTKGITRNSSISPKYINQTVSVHNGLTFIKFKVTSGMIGHKFGEFVNSKKSAMYTKKVTVKK